MHTPVTTRNSGTNGPAGSTTRINALAAAPTNAEIMKKRRGSRRSASPSAALITLPMTNPACTPLVSAACANDDNLYSARSAGTTADAENHSAIAATWHSAISVTDWIFLFIGCARYISRHCSCRGSDRYQIESTFDPAQPRFHTIDAVMHNGNISMQRCNLRFDRSQPELDSRHIVLELRRISTKNLQVLQDQVLYLFNHVFAE